ncbi:MAG: hypothetical protein HY816_06235 [Candidatus Wallbacteria bacterium]|nr:hypothetical protein [Candidatus Wallbacteria bacterium]
MRRPMAHFLVLALLAPYLPPPACAFDRTFDAGHQEVAIDGEGSDGGEGGDGGDRRRRRRRRPPCEEGTKPRAQSPHSGEPAKDPCGGCNPGNSGFFGDPVDTRTGDFEHSQIDLTIPAPGFPLMVARTYRTFNKTEGAFGNGWSTGFDQSLQLVRSPSGKRALIYRSSDGVQARFLESDQDPTLFAPENGGNVLLRFTNGSYLLQQPWSNSERFDSRGLLVELRDLHGNALGFTRDDRGRIATMRDSVGRSLAFTYTASNKVATITDPAGGVMRYAYDTSDNLVKFVNRAGQAVRYSYDSKGRLNSVTNANGVTWLTNTYDSKNRVISQFLEGGTYTYSYGDNATTLTNARGTRILYQYDLSGRLVSISDPRGAIRQSWTEQGRLEGYTDRDGRTIRYGYDGAGNITSVSNRRGEITSAEFDPRFNTQTRRTDYNGFVSTSTYDDRGNRLTRTTPDGTTRFGYDARGYLTSVTEPDGAVTRFAYDARGNLASITDQSGNISRREYDILGRVTRAVDARGKATSFTYNPAGFVLTQTDPLGTTTRWTYDAENNITSYTDEVGATTLFSYDPFNRLTGIDNPVGGKLRYTYDAMGSLLDTIDERGKRTRRTYNAAGLLESLTDPLGQTRRHAYDANGRLTEETDARGVTTRREYDFEGNMTRETDGLGNSVGVEYDGEGNPVRWTDQMGRTLQYTRGFEGRLVSWRDPLGRETRYRYNSRGDVTSVTGHRGTTTTLAYDARGLLTATVNELGERSETDYGPTGEVVATRDATGLGQRIEYDDLDRRVATVDPNGVRTAYELDGEGRTTAFTRAAGTPAQVRDEYVYDLQGRMTSSTRGSGTPAETTVRYAYDAAGNPVAITNGRGKTWRFEYDGNNRPIRETDPLGRIRSYLYDADGNSVGEDLPSGRKVRVALDVLARPISTTYFLETGAVESIAEQTYDAASHMTGVADATAAVSQTFDAGGRLLAIRHAHVGSSLNLAHSLDGSQVEVSIEGTAESTQSYTYDALGRMTSIQPPSGPPLTIRYNARGQREAIALPCGVTQTFEYQPSGYISSFSYSRTDSTTPLTLTFTADGRDNITSIVDAEGTRTFTYDALDRLVRADYPDAGFPFEAFTYDKAGNRTSVTTAGGTTVYVYDDADQLVSAQGPGEVSRTYSWTADGQLASIQRSGAQAPVRFTWSVSGQLLSVTGEDGAVTTHSYEPLEAAGYRWRTATNGSESLRQLWGPWGNPYAELGSDGALSRLFVHGPGPDRYHGHIDQGGSPKWAITDQNDSVVETVSSGGARLESRHYTAFGSSRDGVPPAHSPLGFAARRGAAPGLLYLRARWYDPETGRFLSPDPVRALDGSNRYSYAAANPVRYTDPLGLIAPVVIGGYFLLGVLADYGVKYATQDKFNNFSDYYWNSGYGLSDAAFAGGTSVLAGGAARVVTGAGKLAFAGRTALVATANTAGQTFHEAYKGQTVTLKGTALRFLTNSVVHLGTAALTRLSSSVGGRFFEGAKDLYSYTDRAIRSSDFASKYARVWVTSAKAGNWLTSKYNPIDYLRRVVHLGRLSPLDPSYSTYVVKAGSDAAKSFVPAEIGIGDFWKWFGGQYHTKIGISGFTTRFGTKILDKPLMATEEQIAGSIGYDRGLNVPWLFVGGLGALLTYGNQSQGDTPAKPCR